MDSQAELFDEDRQAFISALTGRSVTGVRADRRPARAPVPPTGETLKERGQQKALSNVSVEYRFAFDAEVRRHIRRCEPFTVDDIVHVVGLPEGSHNSVGALMSAWSKRLKIVGYTRSKRPERHSGLIAVYVSKLASA